MSFKHMALSFCLTIAALVCTFAIADTKTREQPTPLLPQEIKSHDAVALSSLSAASAAQRATLLIKGEAALSKNQTDVATQNFERAGLMAHSADAELGLTRSLMQAGQYRRALSFAAHTAGEHTDEAAGVALYAWLLHIGGQSAIAHRLLSEGSPRLRDDPLLVATRQQLQSPFPIAVSALSAAPTRFMPYGQSSELKTSLKTSAHVAGTGMLINDGTRVLVPTTSLGLSRTIWVRSGLGELRKAVIEHRFTKENITLLRLEKPLPVPAKTSWAAQDAFPGSLSYYAEYASSAKALPAWPLLSSGFIGAAMEQSGNTGERHLGIELAKGTRGGPVFNKAGQVIGMALTTSKGHRELNMLMPVSALQQRFGMTRGAKTNEPVAAKTSVDEVYEIAMQIAVQIVASP